MNTRLRYALIALAAFPATALTQQQKITPPIAVYWMSVDTTSGLPMGGMGGGGGGPSAMDIGRMMLGGGMDGGPNRTMWLELGSQRTARGHEDGGKPAAGNAATPARRTA